MAKILLNVEVNKADLKQVEQQLSKALNASSSTSGKSGGGTKSATVNVDNLRKSYANLLTTIQGAEKYYKKGTFSTISASAKKYQADLISLKSTQGNYTTEVQRLQAELERLQREFAETRQQSQNMHGSFLEIVKGFAKFQLSAMLVMKPLQLIRNAWGDLNETLVETEDAIVALRRVAGDAANANELYELAQRYGQTFENVSELATNFARAGYEWNETIKATEVALLALNTAELDATEASDGMIAILQQFGYEASELESIIDKLNITADNAAVSTDALLKALTRTGSSAKNARLSLEETVAVVTALSESTGRSGENIGTALNSLIQFSTKASALDTFSKLGGDVENTVELYRQGGATVLDIWEELSKVISNSQTAESILGENFTTEEFEALNEELKQSLGENFAQTTEIYDTASTFRKNYFIALLQNLDQVQESLDTMQKSQGYSQKENEQYLDTYTAKVNALQAKWQDIANDEQGFLGIKKDLVDMASSLLTIINRIGGIRTVITPIIAFVSPFLVKWLAVFSINAITSAIKGITSLFQAIRAGAASANQALGVIGFILSTAVTIANIFETVEEKEQDARNAAISTWEANKRSAFELERLYSKYNQLSSEDKEYLTIQDEIVEALGDRSLALSGLKKDSEEYTKAVEAMTEAELRLYRVQLRNASESAETNLNKLNIFGETQFLNGVVVSNAITRDDSTPLTDYKVLEKNIDWYNEKYNSLIREGKYDEADKLLKSSTYKDLVGAYNEAKPIVDQFINTKTEKFLSDYEIKTGSSINQDNFDEILSFVTNRFGIDEYYNDAIKVALSTYLPSNGTGDGGGGGSTETTNLSDVVNKLEAIRENTEKTKELEEKQLALQEAKNQRTVRVFNAETGQWEMQANEKNIAQAEKDLKDTAWDNVLDYLSTEEAQEKLNKGEFTLPSFIAEMLAKPTSDEAFKAYLKAEGILTGAVDKTPMSSGAVYNNSSNNTTNNNNQSYSLNGIPIPAEEAGRYFTPEALELLNQMGD